MQTGAYLYPWDVDGDPAAADRIAGLGLTGVTLAAAYHAVRAVTPFHPQHRIVTRDAAVYYRPDPARWDGRGLRPGAAGAAAGEQDPAGSFERATAALRAAGLSVTAWVVLTHNSRLAASGEHAVRNAFGDVYPWALCAGSAAVGEYAAALAAEAAALPGVDAIELEACGWYGFEHGSAHDKTGGVTGPAGPAGRGGGVAALPVLLPGVRAGVPGCRGGPGPPRGPGPRGRRRWPRAARRRDFAPGPGPGGRFRAAALRGPRRGPRGGPGPAGPGALLARSPRGRREPRLRPGRAVRPGRRRRRRAGLREPGRRAGPGRPDRGGCPARRPDRRRPAGRGRAGRPAATLVAQAEAVRAAGATELRVYHAGLAASADLAAIASLCQFEALSS